MRYFIGVISTICVAIGIGGLISQMSRGLPEAQKNFWAMSVTSVLLDGGMIVWLLLFLREENLSLMQAFGFTRQNCKRAILLGLLGGLAAFWAAEVFEILSESIMNLFHLKPDAQDLVKELQGNGLGFGQRFFWAIRVMVMAPVVEETLFRGVLYPTIKQLGRPKLALWGTSLLFGLMHANMVSFIPLTLFAVLLVFLYEKTDNLLAPIVAHGVFNGTNFIMLHLST